MYLIGTEFDLLTDHKPLQYMYAPTGKPPARVERWVLLIQPYKFRIEHVPGKTNPADSLSPLPVENALHRDRHIAEKYIDAILTYAIPKAMTSTEIRDATQNSAPRGQPQNSDDLCGNCGIRHVDVENAMLCMTLQLIKLSVKTNMEETDSG